MATKKTAVKTARAQTPSKKLDGVLDYRGVKFSVLETSSSFLLILAHNERLAEIFTVRCSGANKYAAPISQGVFELYEKDPSGWWRARYPAFGCPKPLPRFAADAVRLLEARRLY
jgi:hypothetical protein